MKQGKQITNDSGGAVPLKNRQQEAFCARATGYDGGDPCTATDAYLFAYPRARSRDAARANAARLAARPDVSARCAWMRQELAAKGVMDAHAIRAKVLRLRLDVIDKTANTKQAPALVRRATSTGRATRWSGRGGGGVPSISRSTPRSSTCGSSWRGTESMPDAASLHGLTLPPPGGCTSAWSVRGSRCPALVLPQ